MRQRSTSFRRLFNRLDNEDGAVLVIFALLLVVLLGFAAIAVDLSALFVERRHAQTAADVGVLSGAQFAGIDPDASTAEARQAVIDEIKSITAGNLDSADWATCLDAGKPSEFASVAGETDCVSFTPGLTKIRVRVPDQTLNTFFAGVLGWDTLTTNAYAVAGGLQHENGDILPFGVPAAVADATVGCPHDSPNGLYPCDGPDAGNFNNVNISQWGLNPPPDKDCNPSNGSFEDNIAIGADHLLGTYPANDSYDHKAPSGEDDACDDPNIANPPGIIWPGPGMRTSTLSDGLVRGTPGGFAGRLTDTVFSTIPFMSHAVDDEPLWTFIGSSLGTVPPNCVRSTFGGGESDWDEDLWVIQGLDPILNDPEYSASDPTSHLEPDESFEHVARCLREYEFGVWDEGTGPTGTPPYDDADYGGEMYTAVLFNTTGAPGTDPEKGIYNLQVSPRWGWSPVGVFGGGHSDPFFIQYFKPIFLNTVVAQCNNNGCPKIWHAGQSPVGSFKPNTQIESILSFQLPASTLPDTVHEFGPGSENLIEYTLIE